AALGLVVLAGCGDGPTTPDAGGRLDAATPRDAAVPPDARTPDAATADAATDAATDDAGTRDASTADDAAALPDAQTGDGGVSGGWRATTLVPWSRIIGSEPD